MNAHAHARPPSHPSPPSNISEAYSWAARAVVVDLKGTQGIENEDVEIGSSLLLSLAGKCNSWVTIR